MLADYNLRLTRLRSPHSLAQASDCPCRVNSTNDAGQVTTKRLKLYRALFATASRGKQLIQSRWVRKLSEGRVHSDGRQGQLFPLDHQQRM